MSHVLILLVLAVYVGLPLFYAWRLLRLDERSRLGWLVVVGEAVLVVALVLLVGRWDMAGHYTRSVLVVLFAAAVALSLRRHAKRPWRSPDAPPPRRAGHLRRSSRLAGELVRLATGLAVAREQSAPGQRLQRLAAAAPYPTRSIGFAARLNGFFSGTS